MELFPSKARPARMSHARDADDEYGASASPSWRDVDWREHRHTLEIAGRSVNYVDYGSGGGPPVLMIHGLGGCWQNWLENIPRVGQERRVLALDLPGFGESEMPAEDISIRGYGKTVNSFCEQLELGPAVVVGNSMGGFVAAELAIQHPRAVERLVLVSAAGISITTLRRRPTVTAARVFAAIGSRTAARSKQIVARPRLRHLTLQTVVRHPSRLKPDLAFELFKGAGKPGFMDALEALLEYDFRDRLPDITAPTLIVWGEEDMLVPVRDAEEFEKSIPQARKVVLEDTGHVPMVERPTSFNDCLLEFLARGQPEESESRKAAA